MNKRVIKLYSERAKLMQKSEKTGRTEIKVIKHNYATDALLVDKNICQYKYYSTFICTIDGDKKTVRFRSGGWHTKTTKERINFICSLLGLDRKLSIKKGTFIWSDGKDFKDYETFTY